MGNKSKRPGGIGKTSELVAASNQTAMAAIAVLVDAMGGRLQVSYTDLMVIADKVNLQVTTTETHVVYTTTLKPQILEPGLIVPEGPAGIVDLESLTAAAAATGQVAQPAATAEDDEGWDYPGSDGEGVEPVAGELEAYGEDDDDPEG